MGNDSSRPALTAADIAAYRLAKARAQASVSSARAQTPALQVVRQVTLRRQVKQLVYSCVTEVSFLKRKIKILINKLFPYSFKTRPYGNHKLHGEAFIKNIYATDCSASKIYFKNYCAMYANLELHHLKLCSLWNWVSRGFNHVPSLWPKDTWSEFYI